MQTTWFSEHVDKTNGDLWKDLQNSPWKSETRQNAFPQYQNVTDDFSDLDSPRFMANPSNSLIKINIVFDKTASIGNIDKPVYKYNTVSNTPSYYLWQLGKPSNNSGYRIYSQARIAEVFENIGRY